MKGEEFEALMESNARVNLSLDFVLGDPYKSITHKKKKKKRQELWCTQTKVYPQTGFAIHDNK